MTGSKSTDMFFLCCVNPRAGKDEEVLKLVEEVFGANASITLLEENADIYVLCPCEVDVLDRLRRVQANPGVIDTHIEVLRMRIQNDKAVRADHVFLLLADIGAGDIDECVTALQSEVDKVAGGDIELLYVGEVFSTRADLVVMLSSNYFNTFEIVQRMRALPGVVDTTVYSLRRTSEEK